MALKPLLLIGVLAAFALGSGCSSSPTRPQRSTDDLFAARKTEDDARTKAFNGLMGGLLLRAEAKANAAAKLPGGAPATLDLLIISGGGDWGAFGAGVLKGWGRVQGDMARPKFDAVTGVSTGAMIA